MLNCSLSEGFGQLENLRELKLVNCGSLKELPAGAPAHILPLSAALAILALIGWGISSSVLLNYSLSEGFGQLGSLKVLWLTGCEQLRALPEGMPPRILPLSAALAILNWPCIR